jgi:predicted negative regulator of RcsB-dependent stress response
VRILFIVALIFSYSLSKKDFYYSFISSSGQQISQQKKHEIRDGFEVIEHVRELAKDGRIDDALRQIKDFKEKNKLDVLNSDIMIAYTEMILKKGTKRLIIDATKELEKAINSSLIHEADLPKAYMSLVELKLATNKVKDARYFAKIVVENFDDKITNAYGNIFLAKVYRHTKEYKKATKVLYEILTKTTDIEVATIVADELFDVYVADEQEEKAYDLISKVLTKNMDFYANDSYMAIQKVNKLIRAKMPEFAVEILLELLQRTKKEDAIEDFKYKLANVYMLMYDGTNYYLFKAKELYKDILNDYPEGLYTKKAKMFIDEILMREGQISPAVLATKYKSSESMQQKVLIQELLNDKKAKKYEYILRAKKVYRKISNTIAQRFGYESVEAIFDEVHISMIKNYLAEGKCFLLNKALRTSRKETLMKLIEDDTTKFQFFECLVEVPYERGYELVKESFNKSRDANIYLYLEKMAFALNLLDEAMGFSAKVEMVENEKVLEDEFLIRFLILSAKQDTVSMEKFFYYANRNPEYIESNKDNPLILDFYYQYYLYLVDKEELVKAHEILLSLYEKQKEFKAPIYSPFVELELANYEKNEENHEKALAYLNEALTFPRKMKPNDQAHVYYELIKANEMLSNTTKAQEYTLKCKELEGTTDSLYKNMCDKL